LSDKRSSDKRSSDKRSSDKRSYNSVGRIHLFLFPSFLSIQPQISEKVADLRPTLLSEERLKALRPPLLSKKSLRARQ
jgi:hypothetical protein